MSPAYREAGDGATMSLFQSPGVGFVNVAIGDLG
jgi:hypothetical protein